MKISKETISVLKTLSSINTNIILRAGSELATINVLNNIRANVTVPEVFPVDFPIYDLPEFLSNVSLFSDADIEFTEKVALIREGRSEIRYYAADPEVLTVPLKKFVFPAVPYVEFTLPQATLQMALKSAGALRSSDMAFEGDGKNISLVVADLKNPNANSYRAVLGETDRKFKANVKVENIKMSPGEYVVSMAAKGNQAVARFKNTAQDATFIIALEESSNFPE